MLVALLLSASMLAGCASNPVPEFSYDESVPPLPTPPVSVTEKRPRPLHTPPVWIVAHGGAAAGTPTGRIENANAAARGLGIGVLGLGGYMCGGEPIVASIVV